MEQRDYILKTQGFYGYLIYQDRAKAMAKLNEQTAPARVYEVVTTEIANNYDSLTDMEND